MQSSKGLGRGQLPRSVHAAGACIHLRGAAEPKMVPNLVKVGDDLGSSHRVPHSSAGQAVALRERPQAQHSKVVHRHLRSRSSRPSPTHASTAGPRARNAGGQRLSKHSQPAQPSHRSATAPAAPPVPAAAHAPHRPCSPRRVKVVGVPVASSRRGRTRGTPRRAAAPCRAAGTRSCPDQAFHMAVTCGCTVPCAGSEASRRRWGGGGRTSMAAAS